MKKNLSLELARLVPLTFLGSPWLSLSTAPDVRTMKILAARNSDLIADRLEIASIETAQEGILRIYHPFDEIDGGVGGEVCAGLAARIMREYFGDNLLSRVQFRHAARSPVSVYEDFFQVPVTFQAAYNALVSAKLSSAGHTKRRGRYGGRW